MFLFGKFSSKIFTHRNSLGWPLVVEDRRGGLCPEGRLSFHLHDSPPGLRNEGGVRLGRGDRYEQKEKEFLQG